MKPFVPVSPTVEISGALLDELKVLTPGQVFRLSGRDGRHYALLEWEDLEHVLEQAGMRLKSPVPPA